MNNWKKYAFIAIMVTTAGFVYIQSSHRNIPPDLRDAVGDKAGEFNLQNTKVAGITGVPEPAEVESNAISGSGADNFNACYNIYHKRYASRDASNICIERVKGFNFIDNNFNACHKIYRQDYDPVGASEICIAKAPGFTFFNNPNFDACYNMYHKDHSSAGASHICIDKVKVQGFNFIDNNFDACYNIYHKDYSSAGASDICIAKAPRFTFLNNPDFNACYKMYHKDYSSAGASDICIVKTSGIVQTQP